MNTNKLKLWFKNLSNLTIFSFLAISILFLDIAGIIDIKNIVNTFKDSIFFALAIVLTLYVLKSITMVIPNIVVFLAGGTLFASPLMGLAVNSLGIFITMTISYMLGTKFNHEKAQNFNQKHKALKDFADFQSNNVLFFCYVMRTITFIPCDVVSLYCGIVRMPFKKYILGSMLGMVPGLIAITIIGSNITNPSSPEFIISTVVQLSITLISVLVYAYLKKKMPKTEA